MTDETYDHDSYGGTRGHSGGDASRDAAYADLLSGVTNAAQKYVVIMAEQAGEHGVTVAELREKNGTLHHGRVSSAVTKMHIAGKLVALTERRGHAGIYVTPENVAGRDIRPYRRQNVKLQVDDVADIIEKHRITVSESIRDFGWHCHECGGKRFEDYGAAKRHVAELIVALSRGER